MLYVKKIEAFLIQRTLYYILKKSPVSRDKGKIRQKRTDSLAGRESVWFVDNVKKYHRTFATIINTLIDAGFSIIPNSVSSLAYNFLIFIQSCHYISSFSIIFSITLLNDFF